MEPLIKENNSYTFDDKEISNILIETHFDKKASNFDNSHKEAIEREIDKLLAEKPKNCMEQVTLKEVQYTIKDLNSYSPPEADRIGTLLIKNGGDYSHKTITDILNATCKLGYFPDTWKCGNRIYLKKTDKDSYHNPNSYRFISLSNILGKTLEKVLLQRLLLTLEGSNFFHGKNLYAYRKFYNTSHAIIAIIETMCEILNTRH